MMISSKNTHTTRFTVLSVAQASETLDCNASERLAYQGHPETTFSAMTTAHTRNYQPSDLSTFDFSVVQGCFITKY
ncbi:MAG: hypothetical protein ACKO37_05115 [Vampirovibrionales bacterium]